MVINKNLSNQKDLMFNDSNHEAMSRGIKHMSTHTHETSHNIRAYEENPWWGKTSMRNDARVYCSNPTSQVKHVTTLGHQPKEHQPLALSTHSNITMSINFKYKLGTLLQMRLCNTLLTCSLIDLIFSILFSLSSLLFSL